MIHHLLAASPAGTGLVHDETPVTKFISNTIGISLLIFAVFFGIYMITSAVKSIYAWIKLKIGDKD